MTDAQTRDPRPYYDRLPFPKASRFELDAAVNGDTLIDLNRPNASRAEYDRRILLVTLTSAAAEADTLRQRVAALTDVDWLAQVIRIEDPKHDLGAAALAERIIARAALTPTPATDEAGG